MRLITHALQFHSLIPRSNERNVLGRLTLDFQALRSTGERSALLMP